MRTRTIVTEISASNNIVQRFKSAFSSLLKLRLRFADHTGLSEGLCLTDPPVNVMFTVLVSLKISTLLTAPGAASSPGLTKISLVTTHSYTPTCWSENSRMLRLLSATGSFWASSLPAGVNVQE